MKRIEKLVYLELLRRGYIVDIGKNREKEIDFVARELSGKQYYILMYNCANVQLINTEEIMQVVHKQNQEEKRTTINISLSVDDKKFLKLYAIEHETTVAAVIHQCVNKLREEKKH